MSNIKPYTEHILDCYQNLVLTLLKNNQCNISYLGALWPWLFNVRYIDDKIKITKRYYLNEKTIMEECGYELIETYINKEISIDYIMKEIYKAIELHPIIVNVDQYYISHHYSHIYKKLHGKHNIILYNLNGRLICLDTMPEYIGSINIQEFEQAIFTISEEFIAYSYLKKVHVPIKSVKEVIKDFLYDIELYEGNMSEKRTEHYCLSHIYLIFNRVFIYHSKEEFIEFVSDLSKDNWFWEFDRNALFMLSFFKKLYLDRYIDYECLKRVEETINKVNMTFTVSLKMLYKVVLTKKYDICKNAMEKMREAVKEEKDALALIKLNLTKIIQNMEN